MKTNIFILFYFILYDARGILHHEEETTFINYSSGLHLVTDLHQQATNEGIPEMRTIEMSEREIKMTETSIQEITTIETGFAEMITTETGIPDMGTIETGIPDMGTIETGIPDMGTIETGISDTRTTETGFPDMGKTETVDTLNNVYTGHLFTEAYSVYTNNSLEAALSHWERDNDSRVSKDINEKYKRFDGTTDVATHMLKIQTTESNDVLTLYNSDKCKQFVTCDFMKHKKFPYCHCDTECHQYNDCCIDVAEERPDDEIIFECLDLDNVEKSINGFYVVTKCSNKSDVGNVLHCQNDDFNRVGPLVLGEDKLIYRSEFCAKCNGIYSYSSFSLKFSNVPSQFIYTHLNKTSKDKVALLSNLSDKEVAYKHVYYKWAGPEEINSRLQCVFIDRPTNHSPACQDYILNPVISNFDPTIPIRNAYCVLPEQRQRLTCIGPYIEGILEKNQFYDVLPLTVMFSFATENIEDRNCVKKNSGICYEEEVYTNTTVIKSFSINFPTNTTDELIQQIILTMAWSLVAYTKTYAWQLTVFNQLGEDDNSSGIVKYVIVDYGITKPMLKRDVMYNVHMIKDVVIEMKIRMNNSHQITVVTEYVNVLDPKISDSFWSVHLINIEKELEKLSVLTLVEIVEHLCAKIEIDSFAPNSKSILKVEKLRCRKHTIDGVFMPSKFTSIQTYLTYAGSLVSVIALSISICVNRRLHVTFSVPGRNSENLSISLIVSNILFVTGIGANDYHWVCLIVSIALHYSWLTVFSFMSVTIVHMLRNIKGMIRTHNMKTECKTGTKRRLTAIGLILPLIVVGPSCILEFFDISEFAPHYSGEVCFPSAYPGNLLFVSGPITVCILINTVSLLLLVAFIYKRTKEAKHIQKSTSYQQVIIFLRMSIFTGFLWIIGIIGAVFQSEIINFIFVITCSLQGFLIALCNLTTNRATRELKSIFTR